MTSDDVWALVMSNELLLRRQCRRYLPSDRREEIDEMYSDVVVARAHSIMNTFSVDRGVLPITHMCACVRWYAYKWVHRRCYRSIPTPVDMDLHSNEQHDDGSTARSMERRSEVDLILEALPEDVAQILRWHLIQDYTFEEIGQHYDPPLSKAQVKTKFQDAMGVAWEIAAKLNIGRETSG